MGMIVQMNEKCKMLKIYGKMAVFKNQGVSVLKHLKRRYILLFRALWFIMVVCTFKGAHSIW